MKNLLLSRFFRDRPKYVDAPALVLEGLAIPNFRPPSNIKSTISLNLISLPITPNSSAFDFFIPNIIGLIFVNFEFYRS